MKIKNNIKISVAIATYNRLDMVREAIYAALNQTYKPYEIIVFDDASPDNTFEVLKQEFKKSEIVKVYSQKFNTGGVKNWNSAINACSGDYIAWCSDDDRWFTWHLEETVTFFNNHPNIEIVHSKFYDSFESSSIKFTKIDSTIFEKIFIPKLRSDNPIYTNNYNILYYYLKYYNWPFHPSTLVFSKDLWRRIGEFNSSFELADTDWFIRTAENTTIVYLTHVGVLNRRHLNNWSNSMGSVRMQEEQYKMVIAAIYRVENYCKRVYLLIIWHLFFYVILLRLFVSRSRADSESAAISAMQMLRNISFLKIFPINIYNRVVFRVSKFICKLQKLFFPRSEKYSSLGKVSPN